MTHIEDISNTKKPGNAPPVGIFDELAGRHIWVTWVKIRNPKREKDDKVPHNGVRKLYTNDPNDWTTLYEAAERNDRGLSGLGIVMTEPIIHIDEAGSEWQLVGLDADDVTEPVELLGKLATYCEPSPSGNGERAFAWARRDWLQQYGETTTAQPGNCSHMEVYFGRSARFLTVTFKGDAGIPIAFLDDAQQEALAAFLPPFEAKGDLPAVPMDGDGAVVDLEALQPGKTPKDKEEIAVLLAGGGQPEIDRNKVVRKLLVWLIDHNYSQEDVFATLTRHPALWLYLLEHRREDPVKAMEFANRELAVAYRDSIKGRIAKVFADPYWKVVEVAEEEKDPVSGDSDPPLCQSLSGFMAARKPQEVIIEGIYYKGDHNAVLGHPNSGKTSGTHDNCMHVAAGLDLPDGRKVVRNVVVYIAGEDADGHRRRVKLWCDDHHIDPASLDEWVYIVDRPVLDDTVSKDKFIAELREIKPGVIVVDTFSPNYGGESEDKSTEVKKWMKMVRQEIIREFNCCVLTLHHPPKGTTDIHNWRGSGAAAGDLDNIFCFRKVNERQICMDQANGRAKHRTANFAPITWNIEVAHIVDWINNIGKAETTVRATMVGDVKVEAFLRMCLAVRELGARKLPMTHAALASLAGVPAGSVAKTLGQLVDGTVLGHPGKKALAAAKGGGYRLTKAGIPWADIAGVDKGMDARVRALAPLEEGAEDEDCE